MIPMNFPEQTEFKTKIQILRDESQALANEIEVIIKSNNGFIDSNPKALLNAKKLYQNLCAKNREMERMTYESIGLHMN